MSLTREPEPATTRAKMILKNNKMEGLVLLDIKTLHRAPIMKREWLRDKTSGTEPRL